MPLKEYSRKRDFRRTPEPSGRGAAARPGKPQPGPKAGGRRFVIQKHDASRLHFDFRLELDGTLKSWAVPKGVPLRKGAKALAVEVEDHPVDYLHFEGVIPQGQYGGGTVMVWDTGEFKPLTRAPLKDLENGKLHVMLEGRKLRGEWYLVRLKEGENEWLLIKGGEDHPALQAGQADRSVLSGRTMAAIAREEAEEAGKGADADETEDAEGQPSGARRKGGKVGRSRNQPAAEPEKKPARPSGVRPPAFLKPMMTLLREEPPASGEWVYEVKFDGWRAMALISGKGATLFSRNEKDLTSQFPEIARDLEKLDLADSVLDGEIVALDAKGRSSFQELQAWRTGEGKAPLFFYVFDAPRLRGAGLQDCPLEERRAALEEALRPDEGSVVRYSASLGSDAELLMREAGRLGLEGLIGKRAGSRYEAGRRSGAWIKLKLRQGQEFVIGGWTPPSGARRHFGALIVGYHEGNKLRCAGKVGTGFNTAGLSRMAALLKEKATEHCPFDDLPVPKESRWGQALTAAEMRRCHWVKPDLVCQLEFAEWTRDGRLRQPVFLGLRQDKRASAVWREKPADEPEEGGKEEKENSAPRPARKKSRRTADPAKSPRKKSQPRS